MRLLNGTRLWCWGRRILDLKKEENEDEEDEEEGQGEATDGEEKLPLPLKKDGTVHVTNMRKQVVLMGHKIPCAACGNRNDCCKDMENCGYFRLFERNME